MNSKELYELIRQNSRIILPEFGAFLVKDSKEKGFNPSNVSFSPFLRYNDGMLEVFIAKTRGISKEDAAKEVRSFVEIVKNELLEKGSYEIEELGWLKRDQRGSLSFSLFQSDEKTITSNKKPTEVLSTKSEVEAQSSNADETDDTWLKEDKALETIEEPTKKTRKTTRPKAKVEKLTVTKTPKKVKEPEKESVPDAAVELSIEPTKAQTVEPTIEPKPEPTDVQAPLIIETPKVKEEPQPIQIKEEVKPTKNPIVEEKVEETKYQEKEVKEVKRSSLSRFIYTFIAIIIAVVLVLAIRSYYFPPDIESIDESLSTVQKTEKTIDDNKVETENPKDDIEKAYNEVTKEKDDKEVVKQKELENTQEEAIKNTLIQNAQVKKEPKKEIKKETKTITTQNGTKFYIIAGSFKSRDYAEKYIEELKKSGDKGIIVVQPSGMNAVALGSYNTHNEANDAMKKLKSKFPNLWILKK